MKKLWILFIAIFVASFSVLGWVGTEIFRQAPPIPREVVTTEGKVVVSGDDIQNGQNVWQAMGGMEMGSIWGHGTYVAPDWTADYLHNESVLILDQWSQNQFTKPYSNVSSEQQAVLRQRLQDMMRKNTYDASSGRLTIDPVRAIVWTGVSVIMLIAGIGWMVWFYASRREEVVSGEIPLSDPLLGANLSPSQKATVKYFIVVTLLFLLQIVMGMITAHYGVEGQG